jgi:hypothetical protein
MVQFLESIQKAFSISQYYNKVIRELLLNSKQQLLHLLHSDIEAQYHFTVMAAKYITNIIKR